MQRNASFYWQLFRSTFCLSAFTFGGGFVIIPLMRRKFVEQYHWLEEREMLDMTAIAQSSPGAIAVNASILVGYRLAGIPGACVTILATVLPPLIIISLISLGYAAFRDNRYVNAMMKGMQAGVAAVIVDVVINLGRSVFREHNWVSVALMLGAFVATFFLKVNVAVIILLCGIIGYASLVLRERGRTP